MLCEPHEELLKGMNMITRWREKEWRDDYDEGGVGRWINSERAYVWRENSHRSEESRSELTAACKWQLGSPQTLWHTRGVAYDEDYISLLTGWHSFLFEDCHLKTWREYQCVVQFCVHEYRKKQISGGSKRLPVAAFARPVARGCSRLWGGGWWRRQGWRGVTTAMGWEEKSCGSDAGAFHEITSARIWNSTVLEEQKSVVCPKCCADVEVHKVFIARSRVKNHVMMFASP